MKTKSIERKRRRNQSGVVVEMLNDSGASTNVIDKNLWTKLKQVKIKCVTRKSDKKLFSYGSKRPLKALGPFSTLARVNEKEAEAELAFIYGEGAALLAREPAIQVGVVKSLPRRGKVERLPS